MSYLPQFKTDVFVSYRRAANDGRDKWVDAFCGSLRASLVELVGDVSIWRDEAQVDAGDRWRLEIADALNGAAIFLAIISRTYFDSNECRKELDQFLGRLKSAGNGDRPYIVPIFKQPPKPGQDIPHELDEVHRHEFFRWDPPGTERFRELGPKADSADAQEFWEALGRLAQDIMVALEKLHGEVQKRALGKVFVACVGPELQLERERLRADLQQRGHLVVPEHEYLWNADDFRDRIDRDLADALLCVHLVAGTESIEPHTAERAHLQLDLAHAAMKGAGRSAPLVWIQPCAEVHASVRTLVDYIEGTLANDGVEYWRGGLEGLKTQIYDMLPAVQKQPALTAAARRIALVIEEGDLAAVGPLTASLVERLNIEPEPVKFVGTQAKDAARSAHTIGSCDRCLVFWASQSEEWLRDVLDAAALAARAGKDTTAVYLAGPATPEKAVFQTTKARVIREKDGVNAEELRAFFAAAGTTS